MYKLKLLVTLKCKEKIVKNVNLYHILVAWEFEFQKCFKNSSRYSQHTKYVSSCASNLSTAIQGTTVWPRSCSKTRQVTWPISWPELCTPPPDSHTVWDFREVGQVLHQPAEISSLLFVWRSTMKKNYKSFYIFELHL